MHPDIKYTANEQIFEQIDTAEKAYWFGFIAAEGCIELMKYNSKRLSITLALRDKNHLEKFRNFMGSNAPIVEYEKNLFRQAPTCIFRICRTKIVDDLIKLGLRPNKSKNLTWPTMNDAFYADFIRGFLDGDGSICVVQKKDRKGKPRCKREYRMLFYSASPNFLQSISEYIFHKLNIPLRKIRKVGRPSYSTHGIDYGGRNHIEKILLYLFKNSNICLERKKTIIQEICHDSQII